MTENNVNETADNTSSVGDEIGVNGNSVAQKKDGKKNIVIIVLSVLLAAVLATVGIVWLNSENNDDSYLPKVEKLPEDWKGASIIVNNTDRSGNPLPVPIYDNSDPLDDSAVNNEQPYSDEVAATFEVPIVGECEVRGNTIEPPQNYLTGCWWQSADGGIMYTGHAVRGPRVGAFEKLAELNEGEIVTISGIDYKISDKMNVSNKKLPDFIMREGVLSLVTCLTDPKADAGGEFTHNVIMTLENA